MLISIRHKFVFIANRHAGAQGIAQALAPFAEINRTGSPWRRCIAWSDTRPEYDFVFGQPDLKPASFFKFGVIRDPVDWVGAFYRSRVHAGEPGHETTAHSMDFATWWERHAAELAGWDQASRFADFDRSCAMDLLVPFEAVDQTLAFVQQRCGLPALTAPQSCTTSADIAHSEADAGLAGHADAIRTFFAESTAMHRTWKARWVRQRQQVKLIAADPVALPVALRSQVLEIVPSPGHADMFSVSGVVVLRPEAGTAFRLVVSGADEVGSVRTGLASVWQGARHPGHEQAARAKFQIKGLRVTPGATVLVRLGIGDAEWEWLRLQATA